MTENKKQESKPTEQSNTYKEHEKEDPWHNKEHADATDAKDSKPKPGQPSLDHKDLKIESLNKELAELINLIKRVQADFENYRKRVERDNAEFIKLSNASLIKKILPILDNMALAFKHSQCQDQKEIIKGFELVFSQLTGMLDDEGVKPIESLGMKFDPRKHEALLTEESAKDENIVLEELQKGYMLHDMVLRQSKVKISKNHKNPQKVDFWDTKKP